MALNIEDWYRQIPPITRGYGTLCVIVSGACALDIISPYSIYFNSKLIIEKYQFWRILTNFFYFGPISVEVVFSVIFMSRYWQMLEETSFRGRSADFLYMILFGGVMMTIAVPFTHLHHLSHSLTSMLTYVWSRRNPNVQMGLIGIRFPAPYLPLVMILMSVVFQTSIMGDVLGFIVGHLYYYLEDVYPQMSGVRLLKTPWIVQALFPHDDFIVVAPPPPPVIPPEREAEPDANAAQQ